MNDVEVPSQRLADVAFLCPHCATRITWNTGLDITVVHASRRAQMSHWSLGYQCQACHSRIVVHVALQDESTAPHIKVGGYSAPKSAAAD